MTTKLDELVGYLAGKESDPRFLNELADPASEASLFLEAARTKSRALIQEPPQDFTSRSSRSKGWLLVVAMVLASLCVAALLVSFVESRFRRVEAMQSQSDVEARERAARLELALSRLAEARPTETSFERVQAQLEALGKRLQGLENASRSKTVIDEIHEGLTAVHRELTVIEKGNTRQAEELRASSLEVARLLRLLLSRTQPPISVPEPAGDLPTPRRP